MPLHTSAPASGLHSIMEDGIHYLVEPSLLYHLLNPAVVKETGKCNKVWSTGELAQLPYSRDTVQMTARSLLDCTVETELNEF